MPAEVRGPDCWADYAERAAEGWTQQRIADALGVSKSKVSERLACHALPEQIKATCSDGKVDEGHLHPVLGVCSDVGTLQPWLTTDQARVELVEGELRKHRGAERPA